MLSSTSCSSIISVGTQTLCLLSFVYTIQIEGMFILHIISEIMHCFFNIEENVLHMSYHMQHSIITVQQYFLSLKHLSTFIGSVLINQMKT